MNPVNEMDRTQMSLKGWESINYNWQINASLVFYGCNSAFEDGDANSPNFAQNISLLSNAENVWVAGQPTSSFPSLLPNERLTTMHKMVSLPSRMSVTNNGSKPDHVFQLWRPNYMVAQEADEISIFGLDLNKNTLPSLWGTKISPLNVFQNGSKIGTSYQKTSEEPLKPLE